MNSGTLEEDDAVQLDREEVRHLPEGLWKQLRAEPTHAPQHLALAAIDRWGQQARDYAKNVRREYPDATSRELAEVVRVRHAMLARMEGAAAGVPGSIAPLMGSAAALLPDLAALAWIQSRMVVHIAAVYGHNTNNRDTAAELLVLQGIYNTTEAARVALTEASKRVATRVVNAYIKGPTLVLLKQLFRYVGIKFTRSGLLKAVPFIAIPINAGVNEAATRSLGKRAIKFYDLQPRKPK
jgi:uncharacterized protein (DUF697 family)